MNMLDSAGYPISGANSRSLQAFEESHAELNDATELDRGHPEALAADHSALAAALPSLKVFGGCCGTDHHHVSAMASALVARGAH